MKRSILFLLLLSGIIAACTSDKKSQSTGDPIEDLITYFEEQHPDGSATKSYYGGHIFTTRKEYSLASPKGEPVRYGMYKGEKVKWDLSKEAEVWDSTMRAIQAACGTARKCYHKESHARDKDTVYYALALEAMEGERISQYDVKEEEFSGNIIFQGVRFRAGRAFGFHATGDEEWNHARVEYITRSDEGKERPFDVQFIAHDINALGKFIDSLKVYDVSYEYTEEDYKKADESLDWSDFVIPMRQVHVDSTFNPKVCGKLYVVPKAQAEKAGKMLEQWIMTNYVKAQRNTLFSATFQEGMGWNTLFYGTGDDYNTHLRAHANDSDGGDYKILFLEKVPKGTYCIPYNWANVLRVKDGKVEYIPGHKPQK